MRAVFEAIDAAPDSVVFALALALIAVCVLLDRFTSNRSASGAAKEEPHA